MSIAVCAVVGPSRTARMVLAGWTLAQLAAAIGVGWLAPAGFVHPRALAGILAGAALATAATALRRPKMHRIDISGTGELRVTVQQDVGVPCPPGGPGHAGGAPLDLLPGSLRWPGLLVPRLGAGAPTRLLPIWRDSVDADAWRRLAVALAAIGRPRRAKDSVDDHG